MHYTVIFLFDQTGTKVLLQKKNRTTFAGMWNGIGGKVENVETPIDGAIREIEEEIGLKMNKEDLTWIANLALPDALNCERNEICYLYFYAAVSPVPLHMIQSCCDEEVAEWSVGEILGMNVKSPLLAGNGNLQYVVNIAHMILFK